MSLPRTTLHRIRALAAEGHTLAYVADALNRENIPTPLGRSEARWHRETVRRIAVRHRINVGATAL